MAFNSNTQAQQSTQGQNDSWKADGFVNLVLELPGQAPIRLPSLALKKDKYGKLITFLSANEGNVAKLLPYLKADFKLPTPVEKDVDFSKI